MFENSKDILNYALALAVLVLTFLTSWILVYVINIFKEVKKVVHDITNAVVKFNEVLEYTRDKIKSASAVIPLVMKAGEKALDIFKTVRERKMDDSDERGPQKQKKKKNTRG